MEMKIIVCPREDGSFAAHQDFPPVWGDNKGTINEAIADLIVSQRDVMTIEEGTITIHIERRKEARKRK